MIKTKLAAQRGTGTVGIPGLDVRHLGGVLLGDGAAGERVRSAYGQLRETVTALMSVFP